MAAAKPAKEVGSRDIHKRLRAARNIALVCSGGAQAAPFNFGTPDASKWARTDYPKFKQHVELWFSRWDAVLREFDSTIDADLWERIDAAACDLEPMTIHGFHFATAHEAARQSLQWWMNLKEIWESGCKAAQNFAKLKKFPKGSPVSKLTPSQLAVLKKKREVERCVELLDTKEFPWLLSSPTLGIEARIQRECKLAEHAATHDNKKIGKEKVPLNPDIRDLCDHLRAKRSSFGSNIECARDFCRVNRITDKKPEDLFRQAQRFRHRWET